MTIHIFLSILLAISVCTSLVTEGIKKLFAEYKKTYHANMLAGIVAIVLSVIVFAGYVILTDTTISAKIVVYFIAIVLLSWLGAMVGYDKVKQAILQIKSAS